MAKITSRNVDHVVAHQTGTDYIMPGEMVIVKYPFPPPDDRELEWQNCGKEYNACEFVLGINRRRCGLDFYTREDSVLIPITSKKTECVACGQRPTTKERTTA